MTKKLTVLIITGMMIASMSLTASSKNSGRDMMRHARYGIHMAEQNLFYGRMLLKFKDQIGLTDEQIKKVEKMEEQYREAAIRKQADIEVKELKLHSFLKKDPVNRQQMEKMIREIAQMKTDCQISRMNYLLDVKGVLTQDQLDKIESIKKEKRHRMLEERKRDFTRDKKRSFRIPSDTVSDEK